MSTGTVTTPAPLPHREAWPAVARCARRASTLLLEGRIRQPRHNVGRVLGFGDGTHGRVYRETVLDDPTVDPTVLWASFRLRWVGERGHRLFEHESELHVPLFVGFPGFRSKLWLAHDEQGLYRGLYDWDGPVSAEHYARSLWRMLAIISEPGSIDYRVLPGLSRERLLDGLGSAEGPERREWWRVVAA